MITLQTGLALLLLAGASPGDRSWVDSTGNFTTEATLVDFDTSNVVLRKPSGQLIIVPVARLSSPDQMYLRGDEAVAIAQHYANPSRVWTLRNGMQLSGTVIDYDRGRITVQRNMGRILVNGTPYQQLSKLQQYAVRLLISDRDNTAIANYAALVDWAVRQRGSPRELDWQGVLLDLQDGGTITFPLVLFSRSDTEILQPAWDRWAETRGKSEMASPLAQGSPTLFLPNALCPVMASVLANNDTNNTPPSNNQPSYGQATQQYQQRSLQLQQASLNLQGWGFGLYDYWNVQLWPRSGSGAATVVSVPAYTSYDAMVRAIQQYPGYLVGTMARVPRLTQY